MAYDIGILAYGSLIDDPGHELGPLIIDRIPQITPFPVEYARLSTTRGDSPTLIPVKAGGSPVPATILVLRDDTKISDAQDMLWRRETRQQDITRKYPASTGPNAVSVVGISDLAGVKTVFYTAIPSNMNKVIPQVLAKKAVSSILGNAGIRKMDGLRYLLSNKLNGIHTPLSPAYEAEVLKLTQVANLETAIVKLDAEREQQLEEDTKSWGTFEAELIELGDLTCEYGLNKTLAEHPWTTGAYPDYLNAHEKAFLTNCHTGWKIAQKKIVVKMLALESEIEESETALKAIPAKESAEYRRLKKLIHDNLNKTQILRHLVDTMAWQITKGQLYISRRLYQKVRGDKRLSKTNIESVIEAADQLNENEENFALITDLTTYIQTGDILWVQPGEKALGIVEVKTGDKNREIMDIIHDIADPQIPIEEVLPKIKGDKKTLEQFQRSLDQFQKGFSVASIIQNDGGTDTEGRKVTIVTPEEATPRFDEAIKKLGEKLQGDQNWAYTTIDDCLHIGIYRKEYKIIGPMILQQLADNHGHKSILVDYAHVIRSLHRPLFTLPLPKVLIYDLIFQRVKMYFLLELEPFMASFEEFGMKAEWISKSETAKLLDGKIGTELFMRDHRTIKVTHPGAKNPMYVNVGLFGKIYFEHIYPRYVAYSQSYFFKPQVEADGESK